jgi:hypothetical protein
MFGKRRAISGMSYREIVRELIDRDGLVFDTRNGKTGWFCHPEATGPIAEAKSEDHLPGQLKALLQIAEDVDF